MSFESLVCLNKGYKSKRYKSIKTSFLIKLYFLNSESTACLTCINVKLFIWILKFLFNSTKSRKFWFSSNKSITHRTPLTYQDLYKKKRWAFFQKRWIQVIVLKQLDWLQWKYEIAHNFNFKNLSIAHSKD